MSRRRRKSARSKLLRWFWFVAAVTGGMAIYYALHRSGPRGPIPVPGETAVTASGVGSAEQSTVPAERPREDIRKSERQTLDRVLRGHAR